MLACEHLRVRGLMTMAPYSENSEDARPSFARLKRLQGWLAENFPGADWSELSMGMSGDFEEAIAQGATHVRVGSAIFGIILFSESKDPLLVPANQLCECVVVTLAASREQSGLVAGGCWSGDQSLVHGPGGNHLHIN